MEILYLLECGQEISTIPLDNKIKWEYTAVAYDNAISRHFQVTGELLEKEGVRVVEGDVDKLYTNTR